MAAKDLRKYSFGLGDRFAHQAEAQLQAVRLAAEAGHIITPVWNKSYREHLIVGSKPEEVRKAAQQAVEKLKWPYGYFVDADHIHLGNVDFFLESSDYFTLDVTEFIGKKSTPSKTEAFIRKNRKFLGELQASALKVPVWLHEKDLQSVADRYLMPVEQAGKIFRHILERKGSDSFIVEISFDETLHAQTPAEMFFILSALADEEIPVRVIAPKFVGHFFKGIDYRGNPERFRLAFEQHLAVLQRAAQEFALPDTLKLSVHTGSDKFSLYPLMHKELQKFNAGLHLKTAGTTWLEELIGLAEAGEDGLTIAKQIYREALKRLNELSRPYRTVIAIETKKLPRAEEVALWNGETFAAALRHNVSDSRYNPALRQLLHVGYKIAAEMGRRFTEALEKYASVIGPKVTANIFQRHLLPLFIGEKQTKNFP